jgi:hypothetical protein
MTNPLSQAVVLRVPREQRPPRTVVGDLIVIGTKLTKMLVRVQHIVFCLCHVSCLSDLSGAEHLSIDIPVAWRFRIQQVSSQVQWFTGDGDDWRISHGLQQYANLEIHPMLWHLAGANVHDGEIVELHSIGFVDTWTWTYPKDMNGVEYVCHSAVATPA